MAEDVVVVLRKLHHVAHVARDRCPCGHRGLHRGSVRRIRRVPRQREQGGTDSHGKRRTSDSHDTTPCSIFDYLSGGVCPRGSTNNEKPPDGLMRKPVLFGSCLIA
ncbi:hypothetical protein ADK70_31800 [Streptomyces rimosus subsp. pseudoverticillatus]|nr:hypothetical protein ADK70_31800 [Streptomyces rimosus subsp. pseudoverticillatus]